jgi:preprotein translocase subunit SecG
MAEKLSGIRTAQNRSMTFQERFGFLLFVSKFILSKFGVFFVFFLIHLSSRGGSKAERWGSEAHHPSRELRAPVVYGSISQLKPAFDVQQQAMRAASLPQRSVEDRSLTPEALQSKTESQLYTMTEGLSPRSSTSLIFQQIRNYCIIATIVTLFLNPQQTKYFGGLAVVLKQAGFFTKYSKSEKMVYTFSWVFVILFFYLSIHLTYLIRSSYILKLAS